MTAIEIGVELDKQAEKVGLLGAVKNFLKYYATFRGRSSRSEYWWLQLAGVLFSVVALVLSVVWDARVLVVVLFFISSGLLAALAVPSLAIMSRRLRDAGIDPYFLFFLFLPILGGLALFVMMMFPSKEPTNPSE